MNPDVIDSIKRYSKEFSEVHRNAIDAYANGGRRVPERLLPREILLLNLMDEPRYVKILREVLLNGSYGTLFCDSRNNIIEHIMEKIRLLLPDYCEISEEIMEHGGCHGVPELLIEMGMIR